jgi:hypothetical protein
MINKLEQIINLNQAKWLPAQLRHVSPNQNLNTPQNRSGNAQKQEPMSFM